MISHENSIKILNEHIKNPNMIRHCLASKAVLEALALRLNKDQVEWGIAGLLHDIDVEITQGDPYRHGPYAATLLDGMLSEEAIDAIVMHNEMATGKERTTVFQHTLAAGETITGPIMANVMVYPDQKALIRKNQIHYQADERKGFCRLRKA